MKHNNIIIGLKLCAFGLLIGTLGGVIGAIFSHLLSFVTATRENSPWIILLLPLGGIITVALYNFSNMKDYGGTNKIIHCLKNNVVIKPLAAPLIFVSTAITHLFGGSAGKEGAALQLGGASASLISDIFRLKDVQRSVLIMSGMSAVFAGVFGTPLTAAFFVLEFKSTKKVFSLAVLPCIISAIISKIIASFLGVAEETFYIENTFNFSLILIGKIVILAVALSVLSLVICFAFHKIPHFFEKLISNPYIRAVIGSALVIALTALVGNMRYNGSGMSLVIGALESEARWFDFILKIIFTTITLSAGFKGGEIVPTFCIGATFGCVLGGILGLDLSFCAALGLVGIFCCATNSLIGAIFLGIELFGVSHLPYFIFICLLLWPLSTNHGLFDNRFFKSPIFKTKT